MERFLYDPYGKSTVLDANFAVDADGSSDYDWAYRFTSREYDKETGLDYFRARYYSSGQGRFVNRDPLEYPDGMNVYAGYFAANSIDPEGNSIIDLAPKCLSPLNCPNGGEYPVPRDDPNYVPPSPQVWPPGYPPELFPPGFDPKDIPANLPPLDYFPTGMPLPNPKHLPPLPGSPPGVGKGPRPPSPPAPLEIPNPFDYGDCFDEYMDWVAAHAVASGSKGGVIMGTAMPISEMVLIPAFFGASWQEYRAYRAYLNCRNKAKPCPAE